MTDGSDMTEVPWLVHMLVLGVAGGVCRALFPRIHRRRQQRRGLGDVWESFGGGGDCACLCGGPGKPPVPKKEMIV